MPWADMFVPLRGGNQLMLNIYERIFQIIRETSTPNWK